MHTGTLSPNSSAGAWPPPLLLTWLQSHNTATHRHHQGSVFSAADERPCSRGSRVHPVQYGLRRPWDRELAEEGSAFFISGFSQVKDEFHNSAADLFSLFKAVFEFGRKESCRGLGSKEVPRDRLISKICHQSHISLFPSDS